MTENTIAQPEYAPGWYAPQGAPAPAPQKKNVGVRIAVGVAAALVALGGAAVLTNVTRGNEPAVSTTRITTSVDSTGLTAGEQEFILDMEALAGYDAGATEEAEMLWVGNMIVEAHRLADADAFDEGFIKGFAEEGGTKAQAQAFLDSADENLG